jgi:cysteine-rich repeat protein
LFVSRPGSDLDLGWNGLAHDRELVDGASITIRNVRRCVGHRRITCALDSDCPSGDRCRPHCDCDDPANSSCEFTGPTGQRRCVRDLAPCDTNADCSGSTCAHFFGPPLPIAAANTAVCGTTFFVEDLNGTTDAETGAIQATAFLRSRVHLGITNAMPCPRCGGSKQSPAVGQQFECEGGPNDGQACIVDAVSPDFGGVSNDCPPDSADNISGAGLAIRFLNVTTDTDSAVAGVPCGAPNICTDDGSACSTNADCKRCDYAPYQPCSDSNDCPDGACAQAPLQPVTCGLYCHGGFCDDDPDQPCFNDSQCDEGETCRAGNTTTGIQERPNSCADLLCGRSAPERCCTTHEPGCDTPTRQIGECSLKPFIQCSNHTQCVAAQGGSCLLKNRSCFEHEIVREGEASPLGLHCVDDEAVGTCTSNADCAIGDCVAETSEPTTVALFCVPKTTSSSINDAGGFPGPGAVAFKTVLFACRCGDSAVGCDEECDDGNNANGDGCDQACRDE